MRNLQFARAFDLQSKLARSCKSSHAASYGRWNVASIRLEGARAKKDLPLQILANRRLTLLGLTASFLSGVSFGSRAEEPDPLQAIEQAHGGRLGVFAVDTGSGRSLAHRADERFLMCSTFKLLAVAAVLSRVDAGVESLDRRLRYTKADLVEPYPVTGAHVDEGALSIGALCQAAIEVSDSTAANLLLRQIGGPAGLTAYLRALGDGVTRQDRYELAANSAQGVLDTTTPRAMALSAKKILLGGALAPDSRHRLERWMVKTTPGLQRLRAGFPSNWPVGDRPGTNPTETNDVAIIRPPGRSPILVTAYYHAPGVDEPVREGVLRSVGAAVARWLV